jgi:hypothetical protein
MLAKRRGIQYNENARKNIWFGDFFCGAGSRFDFLGIYIEVLYQCRFAEYGNPERGVYRHLLQKPSL